jgi:carbon storage regulator
VPVPSPREVLNGRTKELRMLVLSRKKNESIVINDDITIVVVEIRGDKVRLGVEAPKEVPVHRREVFDAIHRNEPAAGSKTKEKETGTSDAAKTDPAQTPGDP